MDNLTMNIRYNGGKGRMTINLPEYLDGQTLTNIRRLIKVVETSDTPEELEKLHSYVEVELQQIDRRMKEAANKAVDARTKAKELQPELNKLVYARNRYKKNSPPYKELMEKVKDMRERIALQNSVYRCQKSEVSRLQRNKEKFNKL